MFHVEIVMFSVYRSFFYIRYVLVVVNKEETGYLLIKRRNFLFLAVVRHGWCSAVHLQ